MLRGGVFLTKKSFTLSEVLITLVIIGLVAATLIPMIIQNYREKATITKVNQAYVLLLDAFKLMIQQNGTIDTYGDSAPERIQKVGQLIPDYLKITKECKESLSECMGPYKSRFTNKTITAVPYSRQNFTFVLLNGLTISISPDSQGSDCIQNMAMNQKGINEYNNPNSSIYYGNYKHTCGNIYVDINGSKGPNKNDIDLFNFKIVTDGIVPAGSHKEGIWTETFDSQCLGKRTLIEGGYCAGWIIENKNMDYLHCPEKLGWKKALSCK